jgi:hypothetical protein
MELDTVYLTPTFFLVERKFGAFLRGEQRDHNIKTSVPPGADLILEPIATAWTRHDC